MTKTQAHNSIKLKFENGLISEEESRRFHRKLDEIAASGRSWSDKKALYEVWA